MKKCTNCKIKTKRKNAKYCPKCGSLLKTDDTIVWVLATLSIIVTFSVIFVPRIIRSVNDCGCSELNTTIQMDWNSNTDY